MTADHTHKSRARARMQETGEPYRLARLATETAPPPAAVTVRHGLLLGGEANLELPPDTSLLVIQRPGTSPMIGSIAAGLLTWDGPALVTVPANGMAISAVMSSRRPDQVQVYDPLDLVPQDHSLRGCPRVTFSPLADARATMPTAEAIAASLTTGMDMISSTSDNAFWRRCTQRYLTPFVFAALARPATMAELAAWVDDDLTVALQGMLEEMALAGAVDPSAASLAMSLLTYHLARPDRERGTIRSTAQATLRVFLEAAVQRSWETSTYDPEALLRERKTLLIVTPEFQDPGRIAPLAVCLIEATLQTARAQSAPTDLGVFLHDAIVATPLPDLMTAIAPGRGTSVAAVVTDGPGLEHLYGIEGCSALLARLDAVLLLAGLNPTLTMSTTLWCLPDLLRDRETTCAWLTEHLAGPSTLGLLLRPGTPDQQVGPVPDPTGPRWATSPPAKAAPGTPIRRTR